MFDLFGFEGYLKRQSEYKQNIEDLRKSLINSTYDTKIMLLNITHKKPSKKKRKELCKLLINRDIDLYHPVGLEKIK